MTPLDGLTRLLKERLSYHLECMTRPGEDMMFHNGIVHGLITALAMVQRVKGDE